MPKSLLDQFNEQMAAAQQGTAQFAQAGAQYKKTAAGEALRAELPKLLQSTNKEDWSRGAQIADMAGDQGTQMLFQKKIMDAATPKMPIQTEDELNVKFKGMLSPEQIKMIAQRKTGESQNKDIEDIFKGKQASVREGMLEQRKIATQTGAQGAYRRTMEPLEGQIQNSNRALDILDKIETGKLMSTKALATDLNSALASMMSGKAATVYGMDEQKVDTVKGRLAEFITFLRSKPQNTVPPEILNQLKLDVAELRSQYAQQHQIKFDELSNMMHPALVPGMKKGFEAFRKGHKLDEPLEVQGQTQSFDQSKLPEETKPFFEAAQKLKDSAWMKKIYDAGTLTPGQKEFLKKKFGMR